MERINNIYNGAILALRNHKIYCNKVMDVYGEIHELEVEEWSLAINDIMEKIKDVLGDNFKITRLPNLGIINIEYKLKEDDII